MTDELEPFRECVRRGSSLYRINCHGVILYQHPVDKGRFIETALPASDHPTKAWRSTPIARAVNECAGLHCLVYWIDRTTEAHDRCLKRGCGFEELDHAQRMVRLARIFLERHGR